MTCHTNMAWLNRYLLERIRRKPILRTVEYMLDVVEVRLSCDPRTKNRHKTVMITANADNIGVKSVNFYIDVDSQSWKD